MRASTLLLLSDVDGILDESGDTVSDIFHGQEWKQYARKEMSPSGRGGIIAKGEAAEIAAHADILSVIGNGIREENIIAQVAHEEKVDHATYFHPDIAW